MLPSTLNCNRETTRLCYSAAMGHKDIIGKDILRQITIDFANILFCLDIDPEQLELLETEDRRADFLARVRYRATGEPFLLHIELQNSNDSRMPLRMLRYFTDIQFHWPGEPVRQYVIYLGSAPYGCWIASTRTTGAIAILCSTSAR